MARNRTLLFECADFDIICEHKVASRLRPDQLKTYLAIRRSKRCYVVLITRDSCAVPTPVLRHSRYLRPQTTASDHFYWHELYHLLSQRSDRAARDFAEYMQMLGMAPLPAQPVSDSRSALSSVERICLLADNEHIGEPFRAIKAAAERNGLYVRPYKYSIMYTPLRNRTRMLFTVWAERTLADHFPVYVSPSAFAEFYPSISQRQAEQALGAEGWQDLSPEAAIRFVAGLDRLMSEASRSLPGPGSPHRYGPR